MVKSIYIAYIFIFLGFYQASAQKSYNALIHEGNAYFDAKDFDGASSKNMQAIMRNSKDFTAHYNLGNSLYKRQKYDEAIAEYQRAESFAKNNDDRAAALYNHGNSYMKLGNYDQATELYKKALKQDPYNETIRRNLQIAKRKQQEQSQNNQNNNQQKPNDDDHNKQENSGDEQKPNANQQKQSGGENQQNQGKGKGDEPNPDPKQDTEKMPKDLQKMLLNRIQDREKETARRILNKETYSVPPSNEKDW